MLLSTELLSTELLSTDLLIYWAAYYVLTAPLGVAFSRSADTIALHFPRLVNALNTTGYILINLGTPDSPNVKDVRRYLGEFLMDPYVLDTPWLVRKLIVSAFILPFRPKRSAHAYQSIWTDDGSPLLLECQKLTQALAERLNAPVALGMRYGKPSIASAVQQLIEAGCDNLIAVPLYPQYADSTVTTSQRSVEEVASSAGVKATTIPVFYRDPNYIRAQADVISKHLPAVWDHLLLSYHGLPERHMTTADPTDSHCLATADCCQKASTAHATCYRHQVYTTSQLLAEALQLNSDQYTVSFQSRLGRLPWLRPYTDETLQQLAQNGVKHLVVACPAFVADNLETLEEIGIQGRAIFTAAGGQTLTLVPCLNDDASWVDTLAKLVAMENQ